MELFRNPKIDFLGKKRIFAAVSAAAVLASVALLMTRGLQYGIDFRGGADIVLRFREEPAIDEIRAALAARDLGGAQIQRLRLPENPQANDVLIRVPPLEGSGGSVEEQGDVSGQVLIALRELTSGTPAGSAKIDLNIAGESEITAALLAAFPGQEMMARQAAEAIASYRNTHSGLLQDVEQARGVPGVSPEAATWLRDNASVGSFAIRSVDYVGPSVGKELKRRATWAVVGALVAMLAYIWFRFNQLAFGVSAVLTLGHDALVALGAMSLTGKEFDLTVLAAVLTIVGFSINDTIVIFDRVRENIRNRKGGDLDRLFNDSINQTLGRTILTTALVLMVVITLWLFGGSRLNPFAFTLLVGVISGSYSTIYVAAPLVIWWRKAIEKKASF